MKPYYQEAGITIFHGDCREVLPTLGEVDHVITDPPFTKRTSEGARKASSIKRRDRDGEIAIPFITFSGIDGEESSFTALMLSAARRWVVVFCAFEQIRVYADAAGDSWVRAGVWRKPDATPQFTGDRPAMCGEAVAIMHRTGKKR